ncbi:MAG: hypothetical protein RDV41_04740 [Planctomycetota bacterium]|nr:hypothetical protein [Planctomycetota bacterium]
MIGIRSYGTYVPRWRIGRNTIAEAWGLGGPGNAPVSGERSFTWFDEDAVTMAVEACLDCMADLSVAPPDGVLFASSTLPTLGSSAAALVTESVGLASGSKVLDLVSLGAGTSALLAAADSIKSNSISSALIVASDSPAPPPGSREELLAGDAAAAFLFTEQGCIANLLGSFSLTRSQRYGRQPDAAQVVHDLTDAINGLLKRYNLTSKNFTRVAISVPDRAVGNAVARKIGIPGDGSPEDQVAAMVGYSGASHPFLMLAGALEESKPGDTILLAGFGDGADALIFEATRGITEFQKRARLARSMDAKRRIDAYGFFLAAKGRVQAAMPFMPSAARAVRGPVWPHLSLAGATCPGCGTIAEPEAAGCAACRDAKLVRTVIPRTGTVAENAKSVTPRTPWSESFSLPVAFAGGLKLSFPLTDAHGAAVKPGDEMELVFRSGRAGDSTQYCWKCAPKRTPDATQLVLKAR